MELATILLIYLVIPTRSLHAYILSGCKGEESQPSRRSSFRQCVLCNPSGNQSVSIFYELIPVIDDFVVCGLSVAHYGVYRPQNLVGWMICIIGFGLLSILHASSPPAAWVGFQVVGGIGLGILYSSPKFPILAPLPLEKNANALAFFSFARKFSGVSVALLFFFCPSRFTSPYI